MRASRVYSTSLSRTRDVAKLLFGAIAGVVLFFGAGAFGVPTLGTAIFRALTLGTEIFGAVTRTFGAPLRVEGLSTMRVV